MPLVRRASAQQLSRWHLVVTVLQTDVHLCIHEPLTLPAGLHPLVQSCRQIYRELLAIHIHLSEPQRRLGVPAIFDINPEPIDLLDERVVRKFKTDLAFERAGERFHRVRRARLRRLHVFVDLLGDVMRSKR